MKIIGMAMAAAVVLFAAGEAQALPVAPAPVAVTSQAPVILARAGCGFGAHRGAFGGCRLNHGVRGRIRRSIIGAPRGCPPGRHRVRGICRRNF